MLSPLDLVDPWRQHLHLCSMQLAKKLCNSKTKDVIYILDEPTTGLHDDDVKKLNYIFNELTGKGATLIVIEHNPLLIK